MTPIKHLLHINTPKEAVYAALTTPEKLSAWYTTLVKGSFELGQTVTFEFINLGVFQFKIVEMEPCSRIYFECVDSPWDTLGHLMKYDLDVNADKTRVRYSYEGFAEMDDAYANMNYSAAKYLESLRQYCQRGIGEAFGSKNYRS